MYYYMYMYIQYTCTCSCTHIQVMQLLHVCDTIIKSYMCVRVYPICNTQSKAILIQFSTRLKKVHVHAVSYYACACTCMWWSCECITSRYWSCGFSSPFIENSSIVSEFRDVVGHPGVRKPTNVEVIHPSMLSSLVEDLQGSPVFKEDTRHIHF